MKKWCEKLKGNLFFVSQFALDDFKTKYAGSVLGFFWAFVQPVITVLICLLYTSDAADEL